MSYGFKGERYPSLQRGCAHHVDRLGDPVLLEGDLVCPVAHRQGADTGQPTAVVTVLVVDEDGEVVARMDLLDQDVGAGPLEAVVLPVKRHVVRVAPAVADALEETNKVMESTITR